MYGVIRRRHVSAEIISQALRKSRFIWTGTVRIIYVARAQNNSLPVKFFVVANSLRQYVGPNRHVIFITHIIKSAMPTDRVYSRRIPFLRRIPKLGLRRIEQIEVRESPRINGAKRITSNIAVCIDPGV